ncbi:MAG: hypothetical protein IJQ21_01590 [Lachnospiraceae bacterium]|nr:hypothetical protein [Lachnospiraceae bacterium]
MLFEKKEYIFRKKDKETWLQIKKALKAEGIKGLSFGHFDGDTLPTCGCGAKLDPRNYGEKDLPITMSTMSRQPPRRRTRHLTVSNVTVWLRSWIWMLRWMPPNGMNRWAHSSKNKEVRTHE